MKRKTMTIMQLANELIVKLFEIIIRERNEDVTDKEEDHGNNATRQ